MPIYEYTCNACGHRFDLLVRGKEILACTKCQGEDLEKMLSMPGIRSESTHALAMKAARRRDKKQSFENRMTDREYIAAHEN